jgi:hypothetical protein
MRINFLLDSLKVKLIKYFYVSKEVQDFLRLLLDRHIVFRPIEPVFENCRQFCFLLFLR